MTKDLVVVTDDQQSRFARKVFDTVKSFENEGYDVEIKYSTSEGKYDQLMHSAMIIAYEAE
jgi:hypothetical protein